MNQTEGKIYLEVLLNEVYVPNHPQYSRRAEHRRRIVIHIQVLEEDRTEMGREV